LLEETGLVDDQDYLVGRKVLTNIVSYDVAKLVCLPSPAAQNSLLPPGPRIPCSLGAHPTRLAALVTQQAVQKQVRRRRNALLRDNPRIRLFTSRSEDAHNSSVASIDAPVIHGLLTMETY